MERLVSFDQPFFGRVSEPFTPEFIEAPRPGADGTQIEENKAEEDGQLALVDDW